MYDFVTLDKDKTMDFTACVQNIDYQKDKYLIVIFLLSSGMILAMDEAIGKIVDKLNKTGFLDNAVIVFSSDVSLLKSW